MRYHNKVLFSQTISGDLIRFWQNKPQHHSWAEMFQLWPIERKPPQRQDPVAASPAFVSKGCFCVRPSSSSWHQGLCPQPHDKSSRINPLHSRNDGYHRNMSPGDTKLGKEVPMIQQAVMVLILPPPRRSLLLTHDRFVKGLSSVGT